MPLNSINFNVQSIDLQSGINRRHPPKEPSQLVSVIRIRQVVQSFKSVDESLACVRFDESF